MNDNLKIENILGVVANENQLRAGRDGKEYEGIIPPPSWSEQIVVRNGSVKDTVTQMKKLIKQTAWQTRQLAPLLKGKTTYETCRNIWNFLFTHCKYKEDDKGKEQLRTPALSWYIRRSRGIDCDDFSIFASSILYNLGVKDTLLRIARYEGKDYFQHVYPVIPIGGRQYITLDAVLDEYDAEKTPIETKDFSVMNTNNLNGIDISVLGGIEDDNLNEISGILSGEDFRIVTDLEGLGSLASREEELGAIRNFLSRTRRVIARRPEMIKEVENPEAFLGMVDYALKYWNTNKREEALGVLEGIEDRMNNLEGLGNTFEGHEDVELFYGLNSAGTYDILGKAKRERKFFTKVKAAVKKAGTGIKKIAKKIVRYNPVSASIRAAVLLALKVNLLKVSSKLKWGYLTEAEARAQNFDINEWRKVKTQLAKAEGMFVKTLQGKAENFKRAILEGRAGKLSGTDLGFGAVAAAASTAAAVPFITKILALLKNINFNKLIQKVNQKKLMQSRKKAETEAPTEEGGSALPEGGEATETPPEPEEQPSKSESGDNAIPPTNEEAENPEATNGDPATKGRSSENKTPATKKSTTTTTTTTDEAESDGSNTENLPATNAKTTPSTNSDGSEENVMTKAMNWVKENKGTSVLIAAGAAFLIYQAVKPKGKTQLAGKKGGKKKSGKKKNNPPQIISGIKKRKSRKSKVSKTIKL